MTPFGSASGISDEVDARTLQGHLTADLHDRHGDDDTCLFCDSGSTLAATGEDAFAFRDHLARHDHCRQEYQLWRQVISDEWLGD